MGHVYKPAHTIYMDIHENIIKQTNERHKDDLKHVVRKVRMVHLRLRPMALLLLYTLIAGVLQYCRPSDPTVKLHRKPLLSLIRSIRDT